MPRRVSRNFAVNVGIVVATAAAAFADVYGSIQSSCSCCCCCRRSQLLLLLQFNLQLREKKCLVVCLVFALLFAKLAKGGRGSHSLVLSPKTVIRTIILGAV